MDANKKVYVYNTSGGLLGSWTAGSLASNATVEGIATNGTDVWIVDAKQDKVFRYTGAASRLSGSQNAASSFSLNSGNTSPKDIVTDGTSPLGRQRLDHRQGVQVHAVGLARSGAGRSPGPAPARRASRSTRPAAATCGSSTAGPTGSTSSTTPRGRTSGSQSPSTSFALAAGNTNPQGIADPPSASGFPSRTQTVSRDTVPRPRSLASLSPRYLPPAAFTHDPGRQLGLGPDVEVSMQLDPIATALPTARLAIGLSKRLRPAQRFPTYLGLE